MKKQTIKKIFSAAVLTLVLSMVAVPAVVGAQSGAGSDEAAQLFEVEDAKGIGLGERNLKDTINQIIRVLLGFLGIVAVIIILYAGFLWMTAMGDDEKVSKAKKLIYAGIAGIVIILAAYAIAEFVIRSIGSATGTQG